MTTPSNNDNNNNTSSTPNMAATPARTSTLLTNLSAVTSRIATATSHSPTPTKSVRLVAVSKLKPASDVLALHHSPAAHSHFGENYLQELLEKSRLLPPPPSTGTSSAASSPTNASRLPATVDTAKKATLLDKGRGERKPDAEEVEAKAAASKESGVEEGRLRVYVQVNTSGEENKAGVEPAEAPALAKHIREKCPRLKLQGVMTIGAIARSRATTPETENEDFVCLRETRDRIVSELGLTGSDAELELSMGMSSDFEGAIALGSDQVRVGTTIFGDRPPKSEAKVV
ncbi:hypothetical protein N7539_006806 [Penicillium diatomitis]|uniref:Pyridoxal phosphate homeostasis protein n=1 Tax=Penicillium diatomitis TaxID=2819901 RepID=A0A9W9X2K9_9EURO|nr:uncharacterized protein N7539_006806 [Penicillium diatomitis]KAJ5480912.1 hypothetical protein N7539_006806 [Penicillium diatomitis]